MKLPTHIGLRSCVFFYNNKIWKIDYKTFQTEIFNSFSNL